MSITQTETAEHQRPPSSWLIRRFFSHFFILLLITISLSQWVVPVWFTTVLLPILPLPPPISYLALPILLFSLNLILLRSSRRSISLPLIIRLSIRTYFASAFISVFCLVYLMLCGMLWGILSSLLLPFSLLPSFADAMQYLQQSLTQFFHLLAGAGSTLIVCLFVHGYLFGQRQLQITHIALPLRHWPATCPPLRIAHISDIHIGTNLTLFELETFVRKVNEQNPDLIVLTGDILDSNPAFIPEYFPCLDALRARFGVYACLGNHDGYAGSQAVADGLARYTQIILLRDTVTHIPVDGTTLHLIGLDDRGKDWARGLDADPSLSRLMTALPTQEPAMLLSHRPDIFPSAATLGIDLTLSGHTHGGQFALPFSSHRFNLARFITRFPRGQYALGKHFLYVNRGLGVTGQRIRLFTPREIALVTCSAN